MEGYKMKKVKVEFGNDSVKKRSESKPTFSNYHFQIQLQHSPYPRFHARHTRFMILK
jgi:hypothetical protein